MRKITAIAAAAVAVATMLSGSAHAASKRPFPADPHPWDKRVKCQQTDPDGRHVVTRRGNSELGWYHFYSRHNIRTCEIINDAIQGNVDHDDHHGRLEYDGVAFETGPRPRQVKYTVYVQYTQKTKDGRYDAGRGQKIGVFNAFCHNQPRNKCPDWMNR
ncbi:hypothetical protein ACIF83_36220 [Streptomyces sp. NPDC085866]|uniref:hypothetical protein n=1 Tax=Streptomyces sp. NPDC085866 TaxID=3365736 RepID=UPI0037D1CB72